MKCRPTTAENEARDLLIDLMGATINAATDAKNLGRSMTPQQRTAIETMTQAIWNCKEAFQAGALEAQR